MTTPEQAALLKAAYGRRHKYGAKIIEVYGIKYASKREADRHHELLMLERAGAIKNLSRQPRYKLCVNGTKIGEYRADFEYVEKIDNWANPREVVDVRWVLTAEDVKGFSTPMFKWKRKHFEAEYKSIRLVVSK